MSRDEISVAGFFALWRLFRGECAGVLLCRLTAMASRSAASGKKGTRTWVWSAIPFEG